MPESSSVKTMFAGIAQKYDLANHLLSGGMDFYWRNKLVSEVEACQPKIIVDLACGSGDVSFALKKRFKDDVKVTGIDFCQPMLDEAEIKKQRNPIYRDIKFQLGDCLNLPLEDNSIDLLTISFGFRNLEDQMIGLREMHRVLKKPHGTLLILEFSQPSTCFRAIYYFYLKHILPKLATMLTGNRDAYEYLANTIEEFPDKKNLSARISESGFSKVSAHGYTLSTIAIHKAVV